MFGPAPMPGAADLTEVTLTVLGSILTICTSGGAMVNWNKALQKQEKWLGVEFSVRARKSPAPKNKAKPKREKTSPKLNYVL